MKGGASLRSVADVSNILAGCLYGRDFRNGWGLWSLQNAGFDSTIFPRGKIEVSDSQGESLRKNFVPGLQHVDFSQICRHVDKFQICRSVDLSIFSRQINKSTDRQIDRSTINKFDLGHKNHEKT